MKIYELIPPEGVNAFIVKLVINGREWILYYDHMVLWFDDVVLPFKSYTEITADDFIEQLVEYDIPFEEIIKRIF